MKKKNKSGFCQCGKELSNDEIKLGKTQCENCLGKKAGKFKKIVKGTTAILGSVAGIAIFVATKGKKGKF